MRKFKRIAVVLVGTILTIGFFFFILGTLRPKVAGIYIETNPASLVFINGEQVGRTPYKEAREPGEIIIKLIPESFQTPLSPYENKVNLVPGIQTVIKREFGESEETSSGEIISFEKIGKNNTSLAIVTIPDTAQLVVDGRERSFTPYKTSSILAGEHTLAISAEGYLDKIIEVKTYEGYQLTAFVKLAKNQRAPEPEPTSSVEAEGAEEKTQRVEISSTPTGFLRVRKEPSTLADEVAQVRPGERYPLLETDEKTGWYKIEYGNGLSGWITNQYAKKVEPEETGKETTPTPSLNPSPTRVLSL